MLYLAIAVVDCQHCSFSEQCSVVLMLCYCYWVSLPFCNTSTDHTEFPKVLFNKKMSIAKVDLLKVNVKRLMPLCTVVAIIVKN